MLMVVVSKGKSEDCRQHWLGAGHMVLGCSPVAVVEWVTTKMTIDRVLKNQWRYGPARNPTACDWGLLRHPHSAAVALHRVGRCLALDAPGWAPLARVGFGRSSQALWAEPHARFRAGTGLGLTSLALKCGRC